MSRQESHMSRLPADGQAQVDGEQSSAHKPQGSQNTGMYENQRVKVCGGCLCVSAVCMCVSVCMHVYVCGVHV